MEKAKAAELANRAGDLLEATNKKKAKPEDLAALRQCFRDSPELWQAISLSHNAAYMAIDQEQALEGSKVVMRANYNGMVQSLGYSKASPLEKPLIEHVALCWMRLQTIEQKYSGMWDGERSVSLAQADFWERRLSAAQRRYLRACETLARVRRLRLPALQVNIGQEQTNIAGTLAPGGGSGKAAP